MHDPESIQWVDTRDPHALSALFFHGLLFIDALNVRCVAESVRLAGRSPTQEIRIKSLLVSLEQKMITGPAKWRDSELVEWVQSTTPGGHPEVDIDAIKVIATHLRSTIQDLKLSATTRWKRPVWLTDATRARTLGGTRPLFAMGRGAIDGPATNFEIDGAMLVHEAVDPFFVLQNLLVQSARLRPLASDHYLQRWLRTFLTFSYTAGKYPMARVCARINQLFYGVTQPTQHVVQTSRPATISLALLLEEIAKVLDEDFPKTSREADSESVDHSPFDLARSTFGLYLSLRFCRMLRVGWFWDDGAADGPFSTANICVTALRPLDYTYFQARIFGSIFAIPGLNWLFRGALLPRPDRGRTYVIAGEAGSGKTSFALHVMADMASRGQMAIYASLEESYDTLMARLVAFGLVDSTKYEIVSSDDCSDDIDQLEAKLGSEKGLLLLYGSNGQEFSLPTVIARLAKTADEVHRRRPAGSRRWKWRGIAVDSVNGLEPIASAEHTDQRQRLRALVESIDDHKFWGLLISEAGSKELGLLRYLADTVIEMGRDEHPARGRWLEVHKCRTQYFHSGRHPFRIAEGAGVMIYPSLASHRETLRRKGRSALSQERAIPIRVARDVESAPVELRLREKSSTLISGPRNCAKGLRMMNLLTGPSIVIRNNGQCTEERPRSVLLVSFHIPEVRFKQMLRSESWQGVNLDWQRVSRRRMRWYSAGENLSAEQILSETLGFIEESQREGMPIQRIAFHRVDRIAATLPAVHSAALFWPTMFDLLSSQAVTAIVVAEDQGDSESRLMDGLWGMVDYSIRLSRQKPTTDLVALAQHAAGDAAIAVLDKMPSLPPMPDEIEGGSSIPSPPLGTSEDDPALD